MFGGLFGRRKSKKFSGGVVVNVSISQMREAFGRLKNVETGFRKTEKCDVDLGAVDLKKFSLVEDADLKRVAKVLLSLNKLVYDGLMFYKRDVVCLVEKIFSELDGIINLNSSVGNGFLVRFAFLFENLMNYVGEYHSNYDDEMTHGGVSSFRCYGEKFGLNLNDYLEDLREILTKVGMDIKYGRSFFVESSDYEVLEEARLNFTEVKFKMVRNDFKSDFRSNFNSVYQEFVSELRSDEVLFCRVTELVNLVFSLIDKMNDRRYVSFYSIVRLTHKISFAVSSLEKVCSRENRLVA